MTPINKVQSVFSQNDDVTLAYLFGSRATGESGANSDYDFAVYLNSKDPKKNIKTKMSLLGEITKALQSDSVDLLILNNSDKPELNYDVIKKGKKDIIEFLKFAEKL